MLIGLCLTFSPPPSLKIIMYTTHTQSPAPPKKEKPDYLFLRQPG